MSKPFDASGKELIELNPADWLACAGLPIGPITPLDTDLSTVTTEADRVYRVESLTPYIAHFELQTTWKIDMILRFLRCCALLVYRYGLPVVTVLFLLRRQADNPAITGTHHIYHPTSGDPLLSFRYEVIRVWERPVTDFLTGGLATLPLAPLANITETELPEVLRRI